MVAAEHLELKQRVALKVLKLEAATTPDVFARFAEEARATAKLQSENVARVLDVGELVDGTPFLVMEYLAGRTQAIVAQRGRLPIEDAAEYVVQACAGLAEAHACDIVHRDVKPANLFLVAGEGGPTVKIVDFGISNAALGPSDVSATEVRPRSSWARRVTCRPSSFARRGMSTTAPISGRSARCSSSS